MLTSLFVIQYPVGIITITFVMDNKITRVSKQGLTFTFVKGIESFEVELEDFYGDENDYLESIIYQGERVIFILTPMSLVSKGVNKLISYK